jgi:hypothetical protein
MKAKTNTTVFSVQRKSFKSVQLCSMPRKLAMISHTPLKDHPMQPPPLTITTSQ